VSEFLTFCFLFIMGWLAVKIITFLEDRKHR